MSRIRQWLSLIVVLLITLGSLYVVVTRTNPPPKRPTAQPPSISPGALYAAAFPAVDGKETAMGKWQGQVMVVNFWASWCAPCLEEMPMFDQVHAKYSDRGVVFIGVAIDNKANVEGFLSKLPIKYPILIADDAGLGFASRMGNQHGSLPYTAFVDRMGNVRDTVLGVLTQKELEAKIAQLL